MVETETQLRQSEERYRLLAENARDLIWTMEPNGAISYISPSILELRGFTPEEAATQPQEQIHPPDSLACSQAYFSQLLSDVEAGRRPDLSGPSWSTTARTARPRLPPSGKGSGIAVPSVVRRAG